MKVGLDEVGRGALCGPMLVVALGFEKSTSAMGVTDSKKVSKKRRIWMAPQLVKDSSYFGFGWADPQEIDRMGVELAWQLACQEALSRLDPSHSLFVDGRTAVTSWTGQQQTVIHGDALIWQIGAASIVAKVMRDQEMADLASYPPYRHYGWEKNAGYGTKDHFQGLADCGHTDQHRQLFLRKFLKGV
jgi:ribonuclease HII